MKTDDCTSDNFFNILSVDDSVRIGYHHRFFKTSAKPLNVFDVSDNTDTSKAVKVNARLYNL